MPAATWRLPRRRPSRSTIPFCSARWPSRELFELIPTAAAAAELEQRIGTAAPPEAGFKIAGWRYFPSAPRRAAAAPAPQPASQAQASAPAAAPTPTAPQDAASTPPPAPSPEASARQAEVDRLQAEYVASVRSRKAREREQEVRDAVVDPVLRRLIEADHARVLARDWSGMRPACTASWTACRGPRLPIATCSATELPPRRRDRGHGARPGNR